jgi:hypothetical protein
VPADQPAALRLPTPGWSQRATSPARS